MNFTVNLSCKEWKNSENEGRSRYMFCTNKKHKQKGVVDSG